MRSYKAGNKLAYDGISLDDPETAEVSPVSDTSDSPENALIAGEFLQELEKIMKEELSDSERQILNYKLSGIGIAEISVLTGQRPSRSKTRYSVREKAACKVDAME